MKWMEAKIITTHEGIEPLVGVLLECGIEGVQIDDDIDLKNFLNSEDATWDYVDEELSEKEIKDTSITFYLSQNEFGLNILKELERRLNMVESLAKDINFGELTIFLNDVDDEDWENNWKKYYKPFKIGEKIIICPIWEDYEKNEGETVFTIDPGSAFGTGLHQTTQLCIEYLEKIDFDQKEILDLGCGSGILSIISLQLGAKSALAVDTDKNAVDIAIKNGELNNVTKYTGLFGNILTDESLVAKLSEKKYDVVIANIVADVIIGISPIVVDLLKDNGTFIISGIIKKRLDDVKSEILKVGLNILEINEKDEWLSIITKK